MLLLLLLAIAIAFELRILPYFEDLTWVHCYSKFRHCHPNLPTCPVLGDMGEFCTARSGLTDRQQESLEA